MAFRLPTFNLVCRIHRSSPLAGGPPATGWVTSPCQLRVIKTAAIFVGVNDVSVSPLLMLPKGTDVRPPTSADNGDQVEVPQGSGLYYVVAAVLDVAKGFPNEYRAAVLNGLNGNAGWWVVPMP